MKYLIIVLTVLFATGCTPKPLSSLDKAKQDYACSTEGGLYERSTVYNGMFICRSGKKVSWRDVILPPEFYPVVESK